MHGDIRRNDVLSLKTKKGTGALDENVKFKKLKMLSLAHNSISEIGFVNDDIIKLKYYDNKTLLERIDNIVNASKICIDRSLSFENAYKTLPPEIDEFLNEQPEMRNSENMMYEEFCSAIGLTQNLDSEGIMLFSPSYASVCEN